MKSSIWLIDGTQTGTSSSDQSWPGSNGNEGLLHIPQSSRTNRCSFVSYPGRSLGMRGGFLPLCKGEVGVFHSPNRQGSEFKPAIIYRKKIDIVSHPICGLGIYIYIYIYTWVWHEIESFVVDGLGTCIHGLTSWNEDQEGASSHRLQAQLWLIKLMRDNQRGHSF